MLFLSDQQITELVVSGETACGGLRVAEIAHMDERELRKAVRKLCGKCVMPIRYYPDLQGNVTPSSKVLQ